jgi:hypothetical protein
VLVAGGVGFVVLVGLAVFIGLTSDRRARRSAWDRIAMSRRTNAEVRRQLEEVALELEVREEQLLAGERRLAQREQDLARRIEAFEARRRGRDDPDAPDVPA